MPDRPQNARGAAPGGPNARVPAGRSGAVAEGRPADEKSVTARAKATPDGKQGVPAGKLAVEITFLEMKAPPSIALPVAAAVPAADLPTARIERVGRPSVAFYRFLYETVGAPWLWHERRRWSDARLAATVQDSAVEIWLLSADGQPAGYAELDRRIAGQVELSYFGLMPEFIGRKLGPRLLDHAIRSAWAAEPDRLWVHTCSLDHPAALPTYRRAGFAVYDRVWRLIDDPRLTGLIPGRSAAEPPPRPGAMADVP